MWTEVFSNKKSCGQKYSVTKGMWTEVFSNKKSYGQKYLVTKILIIGLYQSLQSDTKCWISIIPATVPKVLAYYVEKFS